MATKKPGVAVKGTEAKITESTAPGRAAELSEVLRVDDESSLSMVCVL